MSWLKLDDTFPQHPKILSLPRGDRWTWVELLGYCARHREGKIPGAIAEVIPKANRAFIQRCVDVELLEPNGNGELHVHGWGIYNGETVEERVRAYLEQHPDATANEVVRKVGGSRQHALAEVDRHRKGSS